MHHKRSFRRKLQAFFLSLLLVLLTVAGVPSAAYTAEAASADTTMAVHFLDVGQGLSILVQSHYTMEKYIKPDGPLWAV